MSWYDKFLQFAEMYGRAFCGGRDFGELNAILDDALYQSKYVGCGVFDRDELHERNLIRASSVGVPCRLKRE